MPFVIVEKDSLPARLALDAYGPLACVDNLAVRRDSS